VRDVIEHIQDVDAVVAARFHNLVLALLLGKPTVSVAYHDKNEALLKAFGCGDASQNIDELDVGELERQLFRTIASWPEHMPAVQERLRQFGQQLDDQYSRLFYHGRAGRRHASEDRAA
jgi:polysaccharide pyruvyl transferase WcaK-like protein